MSVRFKKPHAAFKHGAYPATAVLPREDEDAFRELLRAVMDSSPDRLGCRMECPNATHNSYDERKTLGGLSRLVKPKVKGVTQHLSGPEYAAEPGTSCGDAEDAADDTLDASKEAYFASVKIIFDTVSGWRQAGHPIGELVITRSRAEDSTRD